MLSMFNNNIILLRTDTVEKNSTIIKMAYSDIARRQITMQQDVMYSVACCKCHRYHLISETKIRFDEFGRHEVCLRTWELVDSYRFNLRHSIFSSPENTMHG